RSRIGILDGRRVDYDERRIARDRGLPDSSVVVQERTIDRACLAADQRLGDPGTGQAMRRQRIAVGEAHPPMVANRERSELRRKIHIETDEHDWTTESRWWLAAQQMRADREQQRRTVFRPRHLHNRCTAERGVE